MTDPSQQPRSPCQVCGSADVATTVCGGCAAAARRFVAPLPGTEDADHSPPGSGACSFCSEEGPPLRAMIEGPEAYGQPLRICNECLELCCDIIAERRSLTRHEGDDGKTAPRMTSPQAPPASPPRPAPEPPRQQTLQMTSPAPPLEHHATAPRQTLEMPAPRQTLQMTAQPLGSAGPPPEHPAQATPSQVASAGPPPGHPAQATPSQVGSAGPPPGPEAPASPAPPEAPDETGPADDWLRLKPGVECPGCGEQRPQSSLLWVCVTCFAKARAPADVVQPQPPVVLAAYAPSLPPPTPGGEFACSFCYRPRSQVEVLVTGPRVFICDRCVTSFAEALEPHYWWPWERPPVER